MSKQNDEYQAFIGKRVIHVRISPLMRYIAKCCYETERREVTLMAVSGRWAMVRVPRAIPYVCPVGELELLPNKQKSAVNNGSDVK